MKRTFSFILALLMLLPALAVLPVSAAYNPEGTVLHTVDLADRYAKGGFTAPVDQATFGVGITPLKTGSATGHKGCYNDLTAEGLSFGAVKSGVTGFVINTYDLTKHPSYTISMDMKITTPTSGTYIFFGFDYNADGSVKPFNKNTNFRYNGGSQLLLNGGYTGGTEETRKAIWNEVVKGSAMVNYKFVVTENRLTNVIVTAGSTTVDYANLTDTNLDASKGTFGLTWRADEVGEPAVTTNPSSLLKNVTVTAGEEKVLDVDFAKLYTEKGLTASVDAVALSGMGVGVINKTVGSTAPADPTPIKVQLTAQGYTVAGVNRNTVGAYINDYDLTQNESYIISADLSVDLPSNGANAYIYFGFGYDASKAHYETYAASSNFRWNSGSTLLVNNGYNADNVEVAKELWTETLTNKALANYQFVVENNKLAKVIVTCGDKTVTYSANAASQLDASKGTFGINLRTGADDINPGFTLKKLTVIAHHAADAEPIVNILDPDRVSPTEAEYDYEDARSTKYVDGYVLHYMDFSKVESFDQTGYFVTKDGEPYGFQIKDGVLDVITGSAKVNMLLTGNQIPKNIQNYTFSTKFRFVEPSEKYLVYIHGDTIDPTTHKASNGKNTCLRYNGTIDNSGYPSKYAEDQVALLKAMQAGEWVTFTYTALDRETAGITMECGGKTVNWTKQTNTSAAPGYMGLMFGASSHIQVATVQVVAGYNKNYETLTWPGEANALVQSVNANAIQKEEPPVITDEPTDEPPVITDEPTDEPPVITDEPTREPATSEVIKPTTSAPTNEPAAQPEKKGCGASLTAGAVAVLMLLTAVPFLAKRRED